MPFLTTKDQWTKIGIGNRLGREQYSMTEIQNWGCLIVVSINELSNDVLKSQSHFCQKLQSTKGYNIVFMILGQKSTDVKMDTSG